MIPWGRRQLERDARNGSYPWFSMHTTLYHTHICHSELSGEYPGQSDPHPPTLGSLRASNDHRSTIIHLP
jgi:hypothetical protein